MMAVTIVDIAREVKMTHGTVSRALRDSRQVSLETRRRIQQTARKMGYMPNALARNLRTQSSNTIGVIAPSVVWSGVLHKRIVSTSDFAHREKFNLMMHYLWPERGSYEEAVSSLRSAQVAALIVSHLEVETLPPALQNWIDEEQPIVFLNYMGPEPINTIDTDRAEGFRLATEYLTQLGHRDIAILLPEEHTGRWSRDERVRIRLEGFLKGLSQAEVPFRQECVFHYAKQQQEDVAEVMHHLLKTSPRPTALVTFSDETAALCLRELMRHGLSVPKDISLVGFDDNKFSKISVIPITTLAQPVEEMAERTVQKLMGMIQKKCPLRFDPIFCPPKLVIRESTAPPGATAGKG